MLVFMNKDGIFQKTEWYLVNLFTHGNFDEKLLFKLVKPFFNHFLDKNKQTVQTVLQSLGMCKRQNLGKECQMKNRSHKDEAALLKHKKKLAVPTNVKRRNLGRQCDPLQFEMYLCENLLLFSGCS